MLGLDVIEHFFKHDGGRCVQKKLRNFILNNREIFFLPLSEVLITFLVEDNSTLGARSKYLSLKRNIYTVYKGGASEYLAVVLSFIAALFIFFLVNFLLRPTNNYIRLLAVIMKKSTNAVYYCGFQYGYFWFSFWVIATEFCWLFHFSPQLFT